MKERPILFSAPMVRAVLAGTKTQTRRIMRPQPEVGPGGLVGLHDKALEFWALESGESSWFVQGRSPFGAPGDRLWVRESFRMSASGGEVHYPASLSDYDRAEKGPWKPSIHMPRAASRIDLEVTGIRVERLQDITEEDAQAEGAVAFPLDPEGDCWTDGKRRTAFEHLWGEINGWDSWASNPWVWVVSFKRINAAAEAA